MFPKLLSSPDVSIVDADADDDDVDDESMFCRQNGSAIIFDSSGGLVISRNRLFVNILNRTVRGRGGGLAVRMPAFISNNQNRIQLNVCFYGNKHHS